MISWRKLLASFLDSKSIAATDGQHWTIPACYEDELAPDLEEFAQSLSLSTDDVITQHASATYKVYMYGFSPGYAYLGGVPKALQMPRKTNPVMGVPAQALMVAGPQCLITTVTMPSGWWVIGKSAVNPLQKGMGNSFMFAVGDTVGFEPMSRADFDKYERN